jgi:thiosulfate dehydrogenase
MESPKKFLTAGQLTVLIVVFFVVAGVLWFKNDISFLSSNEDNVTNAKDSIAAWDVPDVNSLPDGEEKDMILYGRDLLNKTCNLIGPRATDSTMRFAGNNLVCSNCHFDAGTRFQSYNLVGVTSRYPQYSERTQTDETIQDRLNDCMMRSMNGKPLPEDSREMKAMVAYLEFISKNVPKGYNVWGEGIPAVPPLGRQPDPVRGGEMYTKYCSTCHGGSGEGAQTDSNLPGVVKYRVPPLWGDDSYNDGAGMSTQGMAVPFIYHMMPYDDKNSLSLEDAYDIEAFINSQLRPVFKKQ